jgi:hypothetical protein
MDITIPFCIHTLMYAHDIRQLNPCILDEVMTDSMISAVNTQTVLEVNFARDYSPFNDSALIIIYEITRRFGYRECGAGKLRPASGPI